MTPIQNVNLILPPGRVGEPARTAGSARRCPERSRRVNEKTAENPRSWPLIGGHLAPKGRRFDGFSLFFQSGMAHRSRKVFWYFSTRKSTKQITIPALELVSDKMNLKFGQLPNLKLAGAEL